MTTAQSLDSPPARRWSRTLLAPGTSLMFALPMWAKLGLLVLAMLLPMAALMGLTLKAQIAARDGSRAELDGVRVINAAGASIGQIRLPETGANLCFGGAKRNRLFITASQSLYAVYVNTSGAHWC